MEEIKWKNIWKEWIEFLESLKWIFRSKKLSFSWNKPMKLKCIYFYFFFSKIRAFCCSFSYVLLKKFCFAGWCTVNKTGGRITVWKYRLKIQSNGIFLRSLYGRDLHVPYTWKFSNHTTLDQWITRFCYYNLP